MIETKYCAIPNPYLANYFSMLIGRVWKILPMGEENNRHLKSYMESLQRELMGNMNLVETLKYDSYFISLLNKIEFLISSEYNHKIYRKEVFECVELVKKIKTRYFEEKPDGHKYTVEGRK